MKTQITELLGIEYPVIQGGMAWVADAQLAANVSKAGGIGFIGAANAPAEWVREQIHIARQITDKPFGVNVMLLSPHANEVAAVVAEEKVAAVTTGAGKIYGNVEEQRYQGYPGSCISRTCQNDGKMRSRCSGC